LFAVRYGIGGVMVLAGVVVFLGLLSRVSADRDRAGI
jgi:hypothetical protein